MEKTPNLPGIVLNRFDAERLQALISMEDKIKDDLAPWLIRLQRLLERACLVGPAQISPDRVTMNSTVTLQNTQRHEKMNMTLTFPASAEDCRAPDLDPVRVSILTPLGLSVLGHRVGDRIAGRILIETMLYQPEANNHYDL